jgi:hypothetical protein
MSFVVDMFAAVTKWQGESVRLSGRYAGPDRVLSSILPAKYCLAVYLSAVIEVQSDADERIDGREIERLLRSTPRCPFKTAWAVRIGLYLGLHLLCTPSPFDRV